MLQSVWIDADDPAMVGLTSGSSNAPGGWALRRCEELLREANHYRLGAEGERRTARAIAPLTESGWVAFHDLDWNPGNIDHVVLGPPGLFLLETKNWSCRASVQAGRLVLDGHAIAKSRSIAGTTVGRAKALRQRLAEKGVDVGFVSAAVVWWGSFPERRHPEKLLTWLHGDDLQPWLAGRPARLARDDVKAIAVTLRSLATAGGRAGS